MSVLLSMKRSTFPVVLHQKVIADCDFDSVIYVISLLVRVSPFINACEFTIICIVVSQHVQRRLVSLVDATVKGSIGGGGVSH